MNYDFHKSAKKDFSKFVAQVKYELINLLEKVCDVGIENALQSKTVDWVKGHKKKDKLYYIRQKYKKNEYRLYFIIKLDLLYVVYSLKKKDQRIPKKVLDTSFLRANNI